ncbi:hypothetical protein KJ909_01200 [Patescibacteria group bacterium]|nr:hypothetical protein [Patescibacteria group bacterium]
MSLHEAFIRIGIALKDRPPSIGFGEITKMFEETLTPANLSMLGYRKEQCESALSVLALLGQRGEVVSHTGNPYLSFVSPTRPRVESAEIYLLSRGGGFLLLADRDEAYQGLEDSTADENLRRSTFWKNPIAVFADRPERVARVGLVDRETAKDLKTLIRAVCSDEAVEGKGQRGKNRFRYKTAWWVDAETKFEFIVELSETSRENRPRYIAYRRIERTGELVAFAQKANVTKEWAEEMIAQRCERRAG